MPFQKTEATGRVDEAPGAAETSMTNSPGMRPSADTAANGNVVVQSPLATTLKLLGDPPSAVRRRPPSLKVSGGIAALTRTWRVTRMRRQAVSNAPAPCAPASAANAITACRPIAARRISLDCMSALASGTRRSRQDLKAAAASASLASCDCNASSASFNLPRSVASAITTSPATAGAPITSKAPISAALAILCLPLSASAAKAGTCASPAGACRPRVSISSPTEGKARTATRLPARSSATPTRQALSKACWSSLAPATIRVGLPGSVPQASSRLPMAEAS